MIPIKLKELLPAGGGYYELKVQENRSLSLGFLNGSLVQNNVSASKGLMARCFRNGMWGVASSPTVSDDKMRSVIAKARSNTDFLVKRMDKGDITLPSHPASGEHYFRSSKPVLTGKQKIEFLQHIDNYIAKKYPGLSSRYEVFANIEMEKSLITSDGADLKTYLPRTIMYIMMSTVHNNEPIQAMEIYGGLGMFEDLFDNPEKYYSDIDKLHEILMKKKEAVFAKAGMVECVLDPKLAGILAHEAIGHTTEADIVLNGSIAGDYLNRKVASELISIVDVAHHWKDELCPVPIFIDDEGTKAEDCHIIEDGILKRFMTSKETAMKLNQELTGNARSHAFSDEPIVRMRNTMIVPGKDKLADMISSIEDGYYLIEPGNGQADYTSEFMFGINLGYEIKNGKIGKAIKETTISGVAFNLLKTVSMVSDDIVWTSYGMCGKKQQIPVGMGGPAIKCKVNIGGV